MPEGTKVHEVYEALKGKGYSKGKSARIAQAQTGLALAIGKKPKHKKKKKVNSGAKKYEDMFK